jgi:hypothetical protein
MRAGKCRILAPSECRWYNISESMGVAMAAATSLRVGKCGVRWRWWDIGRSRLGELVRCVQMKREERARLGVWSEWMREGRECGGRGDGDDERMTIRGVWMRAGPMVQVELGRSGHSC